MPNKLKKHIQGEETNSQDSLHSEKDVNKHEELRKEFITKFNENEFESEYSDSISSWKILKFWLSKIDQIEKEVRATQLEEVREKVRNKILELKGRKHPNELFFDDCLNCGQKINKEFVSTKITEVYDSALSDILSNLQDNTKEPPLAE